MLNRKAIYSKTGIGQNELRNASSSNLPTSLRTLLMLTDGKKSFAQHKSMLGDNELILNDGGITSCYKILIRLQMITEKSQAHTQSAFMLAKSHLKIPTLKRKFQPKPSVKSRLNKAKHLKLVKKSPLKANNTLNKFDQILFSKLATNVIKIIEKDCPSNSTHLINRIKSSKSLIELQECILNIYKTNKNSFSAANVKRLSAAIKKIKNYK